MPSKHIIIIGGGITGLTTAYEAVKNGCNVTLLEKHDSVARGTTEQNVGILSTYAPQDIIPENFEFPIEQGGYLTPDFNANKNVRDWIDNIPTLANKAISTKIELSVLSQQIRNSDKDHPVYKQAGYKFSDNGIHKIYYNRGLSEPDIKQLAEYGIPHTQISPVKFPGAREIITMPGGSLDPAAFTVAMKNYLADTGKFKIIYGEDVKNFATGKSKIEIAQTSKFDFKADIFILCTGPDKELLRTINPGISKSILPFTGVSKTVQIEKTAAPTAPAQMVFIDDNSNRQMLNVSTFHEGDKTLVRFAGLYAAGKVDRKLLSPFENVLDKAIELFLPDMKKLETSEMWVGYRPMTPNGLPIVGKNERYTNLFHNLGQGSSGTSLAPACAQLVMMQALKKEMSFEEISLAKTLAPSGKVRY